MISFARATPCAIFQPPGAALDYRDLPAGGREPPNGANHQPWHFSVIGNPDIKARIRAAAEEEEQAFYAGKAGEDWLKALEPLGTDASKPFIEEAPWLIAIFGERKSASADGVMRKNYYVPESTASPRALSGASQGRAGDAHIRRTQ
jgi:nitroreductase